MVAIRLPSLFLLLATMAVVVGCRSSGSASTVPGEEYRLAWADEFNHDGPLNPDDWGYETGFVRNGELQWYQEQNAYCKGGLLVIEARRESKANPFYNPGATVGPASRKNVEYTSASVTTRGKRSFFYGRIEIRARINVAQGSWPAAWLMGGTGFWPACGEVDLMEYYQRLLLANVAWAGAGGKGAGGSVWNSARVPLGDLGEKWASQFHIWRMDWDADFIRLYCDGQLLNTQSLSTTLNSPEAVAGGHAAKNPFHQPMYLILNQAIGGSMGGDPSRTPFPIRYEIDYVRVYQKPR